MSKSYWKLIYLSLAGKFLLPEARNPNTAGRDDHGVETFAPGLAAAERVHGGAQRLYHQLQVCIETKIELNFLKLIELQSFQRPGNI